MRIDFTLDVWKMRLFLHFALGKDLSFQLNVYKYDA